jgi:hypothetical protein
MTIRELLHLLGALPPDTPVTAAAITPRPSFDGSGAFSTGNATLVFDLALETGDQATGADRLGSTFDAAGIPIPIPWPRPGDPGDE